MSILKCAEEVLKNTRNVYLCDDLESFIDDYLEFGEETDYQELLHVFMKICEDGFDLSGFELFEIPHYSVYIFYNKYRNQMFDVCIDDFFDTGEYTCIAYIDENNNECVAYTIQEAIEKYNKEVLKDDYIDRLRKYVDNMKQLEETSD